MLETKEEDTADVLSENDLEDDDEELEIDILAAVSSTMSLSTSNDPVNNMSGVSNKAKMAINETISVEGLIDSGSSVYGISEKISAPNGTSATIR